MGENFPVNVSADLTQATTEAVRGFCGGAHTAWNAAVELLWGERISKRRARDKVRQAQAGADTALIQAGYARADEQGRVAYLASPEACALFLQEKRIPREQRNLAAAIRAAQRAIESDPDFSPPDQQIDPDFLDCWQDMAEKANHGYARRLWGKILKGELERPGSFPLKTLEIIRRLTQKEAELFAGIARYAIGDGILALDGSDFSQEDIILLYEAGLLLSWEKRKGTRIKIDRACRLLLPDATLSCSFSEKELPFTPNYVYPLTASGKVLLSIADLDPIAELHLEKMFAALKESNPALWGLEAYPLKGNTSVPLCRYVPADQHRGGNA